MKAANVSPWRYLRRLEAERAESAVKNSKQFGAAKFGGQVVDDVHDLHGRTFSQIVIRRMDSDKFAKLKADMAQARKDRIAFSTHIHSNRKSASVAGAVKSVGLCVACALMIAAGPILQAAGLLRG